MKYKGKLYIDVFCELDGEIHVLPAFVYALLKIKKELKISRGYNAFVANTFFMANISDYPLKKEHERYVKNHNRTRSRRRPRNP